MSGFDDDGYTGRTEDELYQFYMTAINAEYDDTLEPYRGSFAQSLFRGFSRAVAENQEEDLEELYDSMFIARASGEELTELARGYGVERSPPVQATGVVEWTRNSTGSELTVPSGTVVTTESSNIVEFMTTEAGTFGSTETSVRTSIQAVEGGTSGNVGADRIVRMPNPPNGVSSVTNPQPTGDPDYTLTDGTVQTLGQNQETDEQLQDRVLDGASIGGAATVRAVRDKIRQLDGTPSLTIYTNRELTSNNGLPALASELVIHAPSVPNADIGQAIHDVVAVTARLASGNKGTAVSETITSDVLNQDRVIEWSEPNKTQLVIDINVVTEDGYGGDDTVRRAITEYIGGTFPDGEPTAGLSVGDDVLVDELKRRVSGTGGVLGVTNLVIDANGDGTDDTAARSTDNLQAYVVSDSEVARVDATTDITVS